MSDETPTPDEAAPEAATEEKPAEPEGDAAPSELEKVEPEEAWDPKRAKEKIRKLNAEIQATKAKLEEAPKAIADKDARISDLEAATLRYEIALDLGLPKEIASRLQGKDRDEMVADAEKLLELLAPTKRPPSNRPTETLRGGGQPEREPEETDTRKIAERMFRV